MMGSARDERTLAREAYFLEFARDIAKVATMLLMVTGGIRRREGAETVSQRHRHGGCRHRSRDRAGPCAQVERGWR